MFKKSTCLFLVITLFTLNIVYANDNSTISKQGEVFSQKFVRGKGQPETEVVTFNATSGKYKISIKNGDNEEDNKGNNNNDDNLYDRIIKFIDTAGNEYEIFTGLPDQSVLIKEEMDNKVEEYINSKEPEDMKNLNSVNPNFINITKTNYGYVENTKVTIKIKDENFIPYMVYQSPNNNIDFTYNKETRILEFYLYDNLSYTFMVMGRFAIKFIDSAGNEYEVYTGLPDKKISIKEEMDNKVEEHINSKSSEYEFMKELSYINPNFITITKAEDVEKVTVSINVKDKSYIPFIIYQVFDNDSMGHMNFSYDEENSILVFDIYDDLTYTFIPMGRVPIKFIDSAGNEYEVHTLPGQKFTIKEEFGNRPHEYLGFRKWQYMNENLITIERDTISSNMKVYIKLKDRNFIPYFVYQFHYDESIDEIEFTSLKGYGYDEETGIIDITIHEDLNFTFMPVAKVSSSRFFEQAGKDFDLSNKETEIKMFNIIKNEPGFVEISLDYLRNYPGNTWNPENIFYTIQDSSEKYVLGSQRIDDNYNFIHTDNYTIKLDSSKLGSSYPSDIYTISLWENDFSGTNRIWAQNVFVEGKRSNESWSDSEIKLIAEEYSPILAFNQYEEFFPLSLDELFGSKMPASMKTKN